MISSTDGTIIVSGSSVVFRSAVGVLSPVCSAVEVICSAKMVFCFAVMIFCYSLVFSCTFSFTLVAFISARSALGVFRSACSKFGFILCLPHLPWTMSMPFHGHALQFWPSIPPSVPPTLHHPDSCLGGALCHSFETLRLNIFLSFLFCLFLFSSLVFLIVILIHCLIN